MYSSLPKYRKITVRRRTPGPVKLRRSMNSCENVLCMWYFYIEDIIAYICINVRKSRQITVSCIRLAATPKLNLIYAYIHTRISRLEPYESISGWSLLEVCFNQKVDLFCYLISIEIGSRWSKLSTSKSIGLKG